MLSNYYAEELETAAANEEESLEEKISSAIEKFVSITSKNDEEHQVQGCKNELREIFQEYLESEEINITDIDSLDNLARIAFFRLVKASKDYYEERTRNNCRESAENLRKRAYKFKRDYELIMISS